MSLFVWRRCCKTDLATSNESSVSVLLNTLTPNVNAALTIKEAVQSAGISIIGNDFTTNEQGDTAVFSVNLNSKPTRDVTINLTSSDTTEGVITNPTLKFTSANWSVPQTFTVTGQNDNLIDGDIAYSINAKITTLDVIYKSIRTPSFTLTNQQNTPNHAPALTGTPAILTNGTENKAYTLNASDLLLGFSDADGNILSITNLAADKGDLVDNKDGTWTITPDANFNDTIALIYTVSDGKGGTIAANNTIILTADNHSPTGMVSINDTTPQQGQTLTASNTLSDVDGKGTISYIWKADTTLLGTGNSYTVTANDIGKTLSVNASYTDGLGNNESVWSNTTSPVTAPVSAGFTIIPQSQLTSEQGETASYKISLNTAPFVNQNVTITFTSSDTSEGTIDNPTLTFTNSNYATPQTLTVRGVDDYLDDGNIPYLVTAKVSTIDVFYKSLTISPFNMTNVDDGADSSLDLYGDEGGSKIDVLSGGNGADTIHGLNMADNLSGGLGNDTIYGGYGADNLFGEEGDDKLLGEQEADYLDGGVGNDTLDGGDGVDTMIGGTGNDTYYLGYDALDEIDDQGLNTDVDTVIMPYQLTKYILPTGIEKGTISAGTQDSSLTGNTSDNTLTGNDGKNTLTGAVGRDSLFGGSGSDVLNGGIDNDVLQGGTGNDNLTGGTGKDSFVFDAAIKTNVDKITDFKPVDDTIKLENLIFTKLTMPGVLDASQFVKGANALDTNDYVIYNPTTGAVTYDSDGGGIGQGVQIAQLGVNLALTNADFVVI